MVSARIASVFEASWKGKERLSIHYQDAHPLGSASTNISTGLYMVISNNAIIFGRLWEETSRYFPQTEVVPILEWDPLQCELVFWE